MDTKKIRLVLPCLIFIIVTVFSYVGIESGFKDIKMELLEEASNVFNLAIQQDKAQRGEGFLNVFHSENQLTNKQTDSITISTAQNVMKRKKSEKEKYSYEEKKYIGDHLFLLSKNPIQVIRLDSLFEAMLYKDRLSAETAIVYTVKGESEYSNPDSLFYKNAIALDLVSIGSFINLQGYVKFNDLFIWNKITHIWTIILVWLGLALSLFAYNFLKWKEWRIFSVLYVKPQGEPNFNLSASESKQVLILHLSSDDKRIRDDLFFNEKRGEIKYKSNLILLTKKSTDLLKFLFQGYNWFQTNESIKKEVWKDETKTNDAVRNAVNRLNNELEGIPGFHVEKIPKKGLQICLVMNEFIVP